MTTIKMTEKETIVFAAFANLIEADTAAEQKAEEEAVAATFEELSSWIEGMEPKSIRPVLASLVKKEVLYAPEKDTWGVTDKGVDFAFETFINPAVEEMKAEKAPAPAAEPKEAADIVAELKAALAEEGATKCSALRKVAASCQEPRASFIQAAEAVGINRGTAARQWQEGRSDDAPSALPDIDKEALVSAIMEQLAHDEIAHRYVEALGKGALKELVKELGL